MMRKHFAWILAVGLAASSAALVFLACGGGEDGTEDPKAPKSGEACLLENESECGKALEGTNAVLMCVKADDKGSLKWTEKEVCEKAQVCEADSGECVVNCDSPFVCEGKECGDDGCGGSCGGCPVGENCVGGVCKEYVCEPTCSGVECGPDGCGSECGTCGGGLICDQATYTCIAKPADCVPNCMNMACGPNGCGGSCGKCVDGTFCMPVTQTCEGPCMPDCTNRECGDDGCGGSCGGCAGDNLFCNTDGKCAPCDPIKNLYCPEGSYCTYGPDNTGPLCEVAGTQKYGEPCGGTDSCAEGICIELSGTETGAICYPICATHSDCGEGMQCMDLQGSVYKVCSVGAAPDKKCNLLLQDCELETDGCYFDGGANAPICLTAGTKQEGEGCTGQPNECAEGLQCLSAGGAAWTCRKFCNTAKGKEPLCDAEGPFPKCANYYSKQAAGYCTKP
ncbi:MAG: hypothetical protein FJ109_10050 [Deltaproteobacteria bacterium]|nr:hypothetical protein [Deltaproteobacteria bacterium]